MQCDLHEQTVSRTGLFAILGSEVVQRPGTRPAQRAITAIEANVDLLVQPVCELVPEAGLVRPHAGYPAWPT